MSHTGVAQPPPAILSRAEHSISRSLISANTLKVLYRLHHAGFLGYLVGGAVRDILLGRRPKDFDIGTNARPQQIRQLFRNARIIGRRFRLALIRYADEVVEVATFRRSPEAPEMDAAESADVLAPTAEADEYGTPAEDAWRRDFTVNGMFYDIADFSLIDFVGGLGDLRAGVIRTIGDPLVRFDEDPVRMLRAVEYAARLGFEIAPSTADAIEQMHAEIRRAAAARIAYELGESLRGGSASAIFMGLDRSGLLGDILPEVQATQTLSQLLATVDEGVRQGRRWHPETLLAALFLPLLSPLVGRPGLGPGEVEAAVRDVLGEPCRRLSLSNHTVHVMRGAVAMLSRLLTPPRSAKQVLRTSRHEVFGVSWELAQLLVAVEERYRGPVEGWRQAVARIQAGAAPEIQPPTAATALGQRRRRRGPRRRRQKEQPVHEG